MDWFHLSLLVETQPNFGRDNSKMECRQAATDRGSVPTEVAVVLSVSIHTARFQLPAIQLETAPS